MQIQECFFYDFSAKISCKTRIKGVGRRFHRIKQQNILGKGIAIGAEEIELKSRGRPALEVQGIRVEDQRVICIETLSVISIENIRAMRIVNPKKYRLTQGKIPYMMKEINV